MNWYWIESNVNRNQIDSWTLSIPALNNAFTNIKAHVQTRGNSRVRCTWMSSCVCSHMSLKVQNTEKREITRERGKKEEMVLRWRERGSVCGGRMSELEREREREWQRGSVSEFAYVPFEQAWLCIWIWARSREWDWHLQESLMDTEPKTCHAWKVGLLCVCIVYMHVVFCCTWPCVFERKSSSIRESLLILKGKEGLCGWKITSCFGISSFSVSFVCYFPFLFL